jgi:hypothetical protein
VAKRSPILGYNHNVKYRGLVFHVQTEDSGVLSPHLFTHLFHGGVIVSTRKLVYDAGAAEEAIKALMQAQHKAALKELRRGMFDDKIDSYLAGTPGLLPRGEGGEEGGEDAPAAKAAAAAAPAAVTPTPRADTEPGLPRPQELPAVAPKAGAPKLAALIVDSGPVAAVAAVGGAPTLPAIEPAALPSVTARGMVAMADPMVLVPEPPPSDAPPSEPEIILLTPSSSPKVTPPPLEPAPGQDAEAEAEPLARPPSGPVVLSPRSRAPRDTDFSPPILPIEPDPTAPTPGPEARAHTPSTPPLGARRPSDRFAAPGATLPPIPARVITPRPPTGNPPMGSRPAMTPPSIVARPLDESAAEITSAPPPSADLPPGMSERPGQYAQHRRRENVDSPTGEHKSLGVPTRIPTGEQKSGPIPSRLPTSEYKSGPVPSRLPTGQQPVAVPGAVAKAPTEPQPSVPARTGSGPVVPPRTGSQPVATPPRTSTPQPGIATPRANTPPVPGPPRISTTQAAVSPPPATPSPQPAIPAAGLHSVPQAPRTITPSRRLPSNQPVGTRPRTPTPARVPGGNAVVRQRQPGQPTPSGGVVMSRPAVIVGAPKSSSSTGRIRKAREDEGRGFGQGLISEKSLDEVILAYLSEDADEK